jgi:hypothetical protein
MKTLPSPRIYFFLSLLWLCDGLLKFVYALSKDGVEHSFVADNWGIPVAFLLVIVFGLGWWGEYIFEKRILSKGRKIAIVFLFVFVLAFILLSFGSWFVFTPFGFWQYAISACASFLMSGFFLRVSVADANTISKLRKAN